MIANSSVYSMCLCRIFVKHADTDSSVGYGRKFYINRHNPAVNIPSISYIYIACTFRP